MLILSRYVFKNIALTTFLISLVLTLIIWLTQSLRLLDIIVSGGAPWRLFGLMLMLTIPRFFEIILPISLALAIVYSMNKFATDSELVVMQNAGLSPAQLSGHSLLFITLMAFFMVFLSGWMTPAADREMERLRNIVKSDYSLGLLRPGIFTTIGDQATLYIAERTDLSDLRGVFIHLNETQTEPSTTITAQHGGIIIQNNKPYVVVYDGMRQQLNPNTHSIETLSFEKYMLDISTLLDKSIEPTVIPPDERNLSDLWTTHNQQAASLEDQRNILVEIAVRLSRPFLTVAFGLMALTPFMVGQFSRRGNGLKITMIILAIIGLQSIHLGSIAITRTYDMGYMILFGVPLSLIGFCWYCLRKSDLAFSWGTPLSFLMKKKERLI